MATESEIPSNSNHKLSKDFSIENNSFLKKIAQKTNCRSFSVGFPTPDLKSQSIPKTRLKLAHTCIKHEKISLGSKGTSLLKINHFKNSQEFNISSITSFDISLKRRSVWPMDSSHLRPFDTNISENRSSGNPHSKAFMNLVYKMSDELNMFDSSMKNPLYEPVIEKMEEFDIKSENFIKNDIKLIKREENSNNSHEEILEIDKSIIIPPINFRLEARIQSDALLQSLEHSSSLALKSSYNINSSLIKPQPKPSVEIEKSCFHCNLI